jgi:hypothetical protein
MASPEFPQEKGPLELPLDSSQAMPSGITVGTPHGPEELLLVPTGQATEFSIYNVINENQFATAVIRQTSSHLDMLYEDILIG